MKSKVDRPKMKAADRLTPMPRRRVAGLAAALILLGLAAVLAAQTGARRRPFSAEGPELPEQAFDRLLVLDTNQHLAESAVLLVDSRLGSLVRRFRVHHNPDIALSPDGRRLFVTSVEVIPDGRFDPVIEVFDMDTGRLIHREPNPEAMLAISPRTYLPRSFWSADGSVLYLLRQDHKSGDAPYLAAFDAGRRAFLRGRVQLDDYKGGIGVPLPAGRGMAMLYEQDVEFFGPEMSSARAKTIKVKPPTPAASTGGDGASIGLGTLGPRGDTLDVVLLDGRFVRLDPRTRAVVGGGVIDRLPLPFLGSSSGEPLPASWMAPLEVLEQPAVLSPDRRRLHVGLGRKIHRYYGIEPMFDQVAILDAESLGAIGVLELRYPSRSLAVGGDGRLLYALSPEQGALQVYDLAAARLLRVIYDLGVTPARVVTVPEPSRR